MKYVLIASMFLSAHAMAKGQVFCKDYGSVVKIVDTDTAFQCQGALYSGEVCFTGDAREAAEILNSDFVDEAFDGTDGEGIKSARPRGKDRISYISFDQKNEMSSKVEIVRCTGAWFRN